MHKSNVRTSLPNLEVGGALLGSGRATTLGTGVRGDDHALVPRKARFVFTAQALAITEALDYASLKLCDLPDGNIMILGALVNLTFTGTGGVDTPANVDMALGTAAASASTLSGAMLDIVAKIDATAGGVVQGGSTDTEAPQIIAASSDAIYLNVADVIGTDGTLVLTGEIELIYLDLGDPAA